MLVMSGEHEENNGNLTLEKARVVERLGNVEKGFSELNTQVQVSITESKTFRDTTTLAIAELKETQKLLTKIINGNGTVGLVGKMDAAQKDLIDLKNSKAAGVEHRWAVVICVASAALGIWGQYLVSHVK